MRWSVLTLFPEMFESMISGSLFGQAREAGLLQVNLVNFRNYAAGRHRVVDDTPYGGGAGMVIKVEPVAEALDALRAEDPKVHVILLSPQGKPFKQEQVPRLAGFPHVALLCGRYEGVDERIRTLVDEELSIGDFVLSGGESAAWVVMDAVSRWLPGVVGTGESLNEESFSVGSLLEYPQYTRPRVFREMAVPEILFSGNHEAIAKWRKKQSIHRTAQRRPELLATMVLTDEEQKWLREEK